MLSVFNFSTLLSFTSSAVPEKTPNDVIINKPSKISCFFFSTLFDTKLWGNVWWVKFENLNVKAKYSEKRIKNARFCPFQISSKYRHN